MNKLLARYNAMPRASRWAILLVLVIVGFFGVVEPWLDAMDRLDGQAAAATAELNSLRSRASAIETARVNVIQGISRFGKVNEPGSQQQGNNAINACIARVFGAHGVKQYTATSRTTPLSSGPMSPAGSVNRLDRLVTDLQFDASPEVFSAVLADFERSPELTSVSRVQTRRPGDGEKAGRILHVTLSVEAWVKREADARGAAPASTGGLP